MTTQDALVELARDYRKLLALLLADPEGRGDAPALMRCMRKVDEVLEMVGEKRDGSSQD